MGLGRLELCSPVPPYTSRAVTFWTAKSLSQKVLATFAFYYYSWHPLAFQILCMPATAPVFEARQVILRGLEVLRLMGDRVENRHDIDGEDLQVVLGFMDEVAHHCLAAGRLDQAQSLFLQLRRASRLDPADEFVVVSRLYTSLLADIFHGDCLEQIELDIREAARRHAHLFHRLESKYTSPHCI